jgi:hypothetical protein
LRGLYSQNTRSYLFIRERRAQQQRRTDDRHNGAFPSDEGILVISRDGTAPQSLGTIKESETEAAVGLAARGSELNLLFFGVT